MKKGTYFLKISRLILLKLGGGIINFARPHFRMSKTFKLLNSVGVAYAPVVSGLVKKDKIILKVIIFLLS